MVIRCFVKIKIFRNLLHFEKLENLTLRTKNTSINFFNVFFPVIQICTYACNKKKTIIQFIIKIILHAYDLPKNYLMYISKLTNRKKILCYEIG